MTHTVFEHGQRVYEDFQLDLHDAADRSLVRLPSIFGAYVTRVSTQFLGCDQRSQGKCIKDFFQMITINHNEI